MLNFKQKPNEYSAEPINWLRLARTERIGPITFKRLLTKFGTAEKALSALPHLSKAGGKQYDPASLSQIEQELEQLSKIGAEIITWNDPLFPEQLKAIDDAPVVLSLLGNATLLKKKQIAIVGSRNASLNGRKFTSKLAASAGKHDLIVTSGLARGIDAAAHEGALESGTIAVLAGGIDQIYPKENTKLYEVIKEKGLIITESAFGTAPSAHLFPRRNRIVSGLSQGVIVVEANERSGSLITARLANEQGREVMAVPGAPADPRSSGPNKLIREGATLIRSIEDVMESVESIGGRQIPLFEQNNFVEESYEETSFESIENIRDIILEQLTTYPLAVDELLQSCHLSVSEGQNALLALELAGRIQRLPGNRVCRIEE